MLKQLFDTAMSLFVTDPRTLCRDIERAYRKDGWAMLSSSSKSHLEQVLTAGMCGSAPRAWTALWELRNGTHAGECVGPELGVSLRRVMPIVESFYREGGAAPVAARYPTVLGAAAATEADADIDVAVAM